MRSLRMAAATLTRTPLMPRRVNGNNPALMEANAVRLNFLGGRARRRGAGGRRRAGSQRGWGVGVLGWGKWLAGTEDDAGKVELRRPETGGGERRQLVVSQCQAQLPPERMEAATHSTIPQLVRDGPEYPEVDTERQQLARRGAPAQREQLVERRSVRV